MPTTQPTLKNWPPTPKSSKEHIEERALMVKTQLSHPQDNRHAIKNPQVLKAMRIVPRHVFMPEDVLPLAYADSALPIGSDQTISQPYIVALMTELLELHPTLKVLEIGTGSGYQAAVLSHFTPHVYSIEIVEELHQRAKDTLNKEGYTTVRLRFGDGHAGWKEEAPFDAITVTCAEDKIPPALWSQLKIGGKMVIPLEEANERQVLKVITKGPKEEKIIRSIIPVRFVPMVEPTLH